MCTLEDFENNVRINCILSALKFKDSSATNSTLFCNETYAIVNKFLKIAPEKINFAIESL